MCTGAEYLEPDIRWREYFETHILINLSGNNNYNNKKWKYNNITGKLRSFILEHLPAQ